MNDAREGSRIEEGSWLTGHFSLLRRGWRLWRRAGLAALLRRATEAALGTIRHRSRWLRVYLDPGAKARNIEIGHVPSPEALRRHRDPVDIILCVHNAQADLERCLESLLEWTTPPTNLILVDDGSDGLTAAFLEREAARTGARLIRNPTARGYTRAANQGLSVASAPYVVLLNSDTKLTPEWLDRLVACAESNERIALVGPLSNTASWQSIPNVEAGGDWAANPLPEGLSAEEMARLVASLSARLYPRMPFLNGFCLLIRRSALEQVGILDEANFGAGYGEENDLAIRLRRARWELALADDVYIHHAQSRSYSHEVRHRLSQRADVALRAKHGGSWIDEGVAYCREDRVLQGIRARARVLTRREEAIRQGRAEFAGRRVLIVIPTREPGGGTNIVTTEARAMRQMGVEVALFNLSAHRTTFQRGYPGLDVPVLFGEIDDIPALAARYDAVVATFNPSVAWLGRPEVNGRQIIRGYYIQDYEPLFYTPGSTGYRTALESYSLYPDLRRFAKTEWAARQVELHTGVSCEVVGASFDIDLFMPRPRKGKDWPARPIRLAAMIRPSSPYRRPRETMELLRRVSRTYGGQVEVFLFGTVLEDPRFQALPHDFPWRLAGILNQRQVAVLLNETDIFIDLSSHQAMGLTAMEALACGCATIVPERGGTGTFARHATNCLVVNTDDETVCWEATRQLIEDSAQRQRLGAQALVDICEFCPEAAALQILKALF